MKYLLMVCLLGFFEIANAEETCKIQFHISNVSDKSGLSFKLGESFSSISNEFQVAKGHKVIFFARVPNNPSTRVEYGEWRDKSEVKLIHCLGKPFIVDDGQCATDVYISFTPQGSCRVAFTPF